MKRILMVILMLFIMVFLSGCLVQSLTPFYVEDALIQFPEVYGSWRLIRDDSGDVSQSNIQPWQFTGERITTFDGRGLEAKLQARYFSVNDTIFMDITAGDPYTSSVSEIWAMHVAPVHTLVKVMIRKDTLILMPLNYDWLESALSNKKVALPSIKLETADMTVFNPAPEKWMAFLKEYKDEKGVFSEERRYEFKKL